MTFKKTYKIILLPLIFRFYNATLNAFGIYRDKNNCDHCENWKLNKIEFIWIHETSSTTSNRPSCWCWGDCPVCWRLLWASSLPARSLAPAVMFASSSPVWTAAFWSLDRALTSLFIQAFWLGEWSSFADKWCHWLMLLSWVEVSLNISLHFNSFWWWFDPFDQLEDRRQMKQGDMICWWRIVLPLVGMWTSCTLHHWKRWWTLWAESTIDISALDIKHLVNSVRLLHCLCRPRANNLELPTSYVARLQHRLYAVLQVWL